jgi:hypothetical protein
MFTSSLLKTVPQQLKPGIEKQASYRSTEDYA